MVPTEPRSPDRPRVILIVDDEQDVRDLVREILRTANFTPLTARDGEEALALIRELEGRIDLVLTDVMMPLLDGPTLARRLAADWPALPTLFMTGYPADTLAALGFLPLDAPRIEKPFRIRDLVSRVRASLGLPPPADGPAV
jgi:two-component system cell cycle sensor histidine kinase/response regulator CckA